MTTYRQWNEGEGGGGGGGAVGQWACAPTKVYSAPTIYCVTVFVNKVISAPLEGIRNTVYTC